MLDFITEAAQPLMEQVQTYKGAGLRFPQHADDGVAGRISVTRERLVAKKARAQAIFENLEASHAVLA